MERLFVNVSVEILGPCKRLMRVEIEAAKVDEVFGEITREFQREARLPGFRPGKAPKDMVAKRYETEIKDEAKRKLLSDAYRKAIADEKLDVVGAPDIEEIEFAPGQKFQFAATLEIAPQFELPEYKGLPARREIGSVTPEDIEHALHLLGERQTQYQTVARELKEGDVAVVNYTGACDGKPITETAPTARGLAEKKAFWINVDKTSFIPGFGEQLIGMKAGDKRTVTVDFPTDFVTPQLAGKKGVYEVELVEAKEKVAPQFDEAFAKSYGAESMEKLREGVRADLQNEWNLKQSRSIRNQVVQSLLGKIQCDYRVPSGRGDARDCLFHCQRQPAARRSQGSARRGEGKNLRHGQRHRAGPDQGHLCLPAGGGEGRRSRGTSRNQRRLQDMATQYKMPVDKLVKELEKRGGLSSIYSQLLNEKVIDLLVQYAHLEDVPRTSAVTPA